MKAESHSPAPSSPIAKVLRGAFVVALVYGFLVSIRLMGSAFKAMGAETASGLYEGIANPFAGLAVGILATVLVQSSSTSTSTIVSLVGQTGGTALPLKTAIPMIMGANIGTTITNTIVSLGHIRQGGAFRRAFAAATVHDFFNLILVAIMLPVELMTGVLEQSAITLSEQFSGVAGVERMDDPLKRLVKAGEKPIRELVESSGLEGGALSLVLVAVALALIAVCLVQITRNMRILISGRLEAAMNRTLGRSGILGIVVGAVLTVSVQSSSITTSLLVPMCAAGILSLKNAFPIMLGANIGTTVTGLLASLATDSSTGLTIALVHTLFNLAGVLLIYPIPYFRNVPIRLARGLAIKAQRNPAWVVAYVVGVFVVTPLLGYLLLRTAS